MMKPSASSFVRLVVILWVMFSGSSMVWADEQVLPDCDPALMTHGPNYSQGPDCTITWVDNNRLQAVTWTEVPGDFAEPALTQTAENGAVLSAGQLPELIDVDQDGWLDLMTFTTVGMVNGTFDVFFYDPGTGRFNKAEPLFGHTLERDISGYLVVAGRSGPGTIMRFYKAAQGVLTFHFEIDPFGLDASDQGFTCDVTTERSDGQPSGDSAAIPDDPTLLEHYCKTETPADHPSRGVLLQEDPAKIDRVPSGTVFYCRLQGGTHKVNIAHVRQGLRYAYGPIDGVPELVMDHAYDDVTVLPDNGAGPSRFGKITFTNDDYEYNAFYTYELFDQNGDLIQTGNSTIFPNDTFTRGLVVYQGGDVANPVFNKDCELDRSYDDIFGFRRP